MTDLQRYNPGYRKEIIAEEARCDEWARSKGFRSFNHWKNKSSITEFNKGMSELYPKQPKTPAL